MNLRARSPAVYICRDCLFAEVQRASANLQEASNVSSAAVDHVTRRVRN